MFDHCTFDRPHLLITPLLLVIDRLYPALHQLSLPRARWIIIGLHLLLLAAIGEQQGILADKEALKYIGCAQDVLNDDLSDLTSNYLKYGAYVLFLVPFVAIGQMWLAVGVQILLGIIAAEALARYTERATGNVGLGRLAMALFLLCPLIQSWALALYTEHFFACMAIIFIELLDRDRRIGAPTIALGIITLFARPTGMFFVVPAMLWMWRERLPSALRPWFVPGACIALFLFAISIPRIAPAQLGPIASGQVIAGIGGSGTDGFDGQTIIAAQRFLVDRVGLVEWGGITLRRAVSLFTLTRPYYSVAHNNLNAIWYVLFPLAFIGVWRSWQVSRIRLVLLVLMLNILLVAVTHDEWSGRFLVPLLPWIMVLAVSALRNSVRVVARV